MPEKQYEKWKKWGLGSAGGTDGCFSCASGNYQRGRRIEKTRRLKLCSDSRSDRETTTNDKKEKTDMSNTNNSNRLVVPGAREAMDKFKMEAANEVGVNLKQGYNGDLTSKQAGSVGGQMVKNVCPVRSASFRRESRTARGHGITVRYAAGLTV